MIKNIYNINLIFFASGHCNAEIMLMYKLCKEGYKIGTVLFLDIIYSDSLVRYDNSDEYETTDNKILIALKECKKIGLFKYCLFFDKYVALENHLRECYLYDKNKKHD